MVVVVFIVVIGFPVQVVPVRQMVGLVILDLHQEMIQHLSLVLNESCLEHGCSFQVHTVAIPRDRLVTLEGNRLGLAVQVEATFAWNSPNT